MNSMKIKEAAELYDRKLDRDTQQSPEHKDLMDIFEQTWRAVSSLEWESDQLKKRVDDQEAANR